ncbi:MAG: hypothetical protein IPL79_07020 [Myxococcales bacterium]|nr:hypothetical protein [Myxococcales bacterium]
MAGAPQIAYKTAIEFLERGIARMPNEWRILQQAGQIYLVDLKSDNPIEDRAWKERGAMLLERAVRQPGAPKKLATLAAHIRTSMGQHERARENLREMLALATTKEERDKFAKRLADLSATSADALAYEYEINQAQTERQWKAALPQVPLADSLLLRGAPEPTLDPASLATASAHQAAMPPLPPLYWEAAP